MVQHSSHRPDPGATLRELLSSERASAIASNLQRHPFRRLSDREEVRLSVEVLCQSIHVNRLDGSPFPVLGVPGGDVDPYFMHSTQSARRELDELRELGIKRVYLQLISDPSERDYTRRLDQLTVMLERIRSHAGPDFELIVDPQGLCRRSDLRWGISDDADRADRIDAHGTLELLGRAVQQFAQAGMNTFMTIGRINHEAEVVRAGIAKADRPVRLMSFSTNSETPNAYFDTTRYDVGRSKTGQKILVANTAEMILRAAIDLAEGTDVVVQKPMEGLHVLSLLGVLLSRGMSLRAILALFPSGERLWRAVEPEHARLERLTSELEAGRRVELGAYEVSGSYSILCDSARTYSPELAWAMLDELYRNAVSAGGRHVTTLVARSTKWYVRRRRSQEGAR